MERLEGLLSAEITAFFPRSVREKHPTDSQFRQTVDGIQGTNSGDSLANQAGHDARFLILSRELARRTLARRRGFRGGCTSLTAERPRSGVGLW